MCVCEEWMMWCGVGGYGVWVCEEWMVNCKKINNLLYALYC